MSTKRGFAKIAGSKKHKQYSSKGGQARVPKGTAKLSPSERTERARDAANALWRRRRFAAQVRDAINSEGAIQPKEDGQHRENE